MLHDLHDFFVQCPAMFVSLRAVFALLPSASRIVESAHGIMRAICDGQIPIDFMNSKMRWKMNDSCSMREERRKTIPVIVAVARKDGKPISQKAAKHSDRRVTLLKIGEQILHSMKVYTPEVIDSVPPEKIMISTINKMSAKRNEEEMLVKKREAAERRRERSRRAPVDLDKIEEEAMNTKTEYDENWQSRDNDEQVQSVNEPVVRRVEEAKEN